MDLILVLSPPSLHAQITVKALGIGKHVVVEAPAGINQNETLRKVKAALYYPSLISSGLSKNEIATVIWTKDSLVFFRFLSYDQIRNPCENLHQMSQSGLEIKQYLGPKS